jgi:microcystin-dependent protein
MASPFLGEIRIVSFNFAPKGWAICNGQLLPINQNQALFSLLGTTYGGDGRTTFALPNLQGRTPIHMGNGHTLGELGGEQAHTLAISELATHRHTAGAQSAAGDAAVPSIDVVLGSPLNLSYGSPNDLVALVPASVGNTGGGQPHDNMQPYLTLNFCIALQGIFPSQN